MYSSEIFMLEVIVLHLIWSYKQTCCQSRKSKDVTNNINNKSVLFKSPSKLQQCDSEPLSTNTKTLTPKKIKGSFILCIPLKRSSVCLSVKPVLTDLFQSWVN